MNELPNDLPPLPEPPDGCRWVYRGKGYESPLGLFAYKSSKGRWMFDSKALGDEWLTYAEAVPIQPADPLAEALEEIARQDVTEIALDPDWPRRIATTALSDHRARKG